MNSKYFFWAKIGGVAVFLFLEAYLVGCGRIDGLPQPNSGPSIPGLPDPVPNPPVGVVSNADGFYVQHMQNSKYTYVSHKGNATMSERCTANAGELVSCYVEAQELDLYIQGVELQYNVPSTMCSYFVVAPYYYFKGLAGEGPTTVQIDKDASGNVGIDNLPTAAGDGVIDTPGTASPTCQYDYSKNPNGVNCCGGKYVLTSRTWDTTTSAYTSVVSPEASWGGRVANCLSGPAMKTQSLTKDGFPIMPIFYVGGTGINSTYKVAGPIDFGKQTNVHAANYWDAADYDASSLFRPVAFQSATIASLSNARYRTNPVYDFICYDTAGEILSEIQVYVRSWTKKAEFNNLVASPGSYQVNGNEPAPWTTTGYFDYYNWFSYGNNANLLASPPQGPGGSYPGNDE